MRMLKLKDFGLILMFCVSAGVGSGVSAQPSILNYQGYVVDSVGVPTENEHSLSFSIYDAATGGSELWTETFTVAFDNGYFSVLLGDNVSVDSNLFSSGNEFYLGITIDGDSEMSPRQRIVSTAFSFRSGTSGTADMADMITPPE